MAVNVYMAVTSLLIGNGGGASRVDQRLRATCRPYSVPFAACVKYFVFEALSLDPKQAQAVPRLRNHQVGHTTVLWRGGGVIEERKRKDKHRK